LLKLGFGGVNAEFVVLRLAGAGGESGWGNRKDAGKRGDGKGGLEEGHGVHDERWLICFMIG
jgi:hypothetical protein